MVFLEEGNVLVMLLFYVGSLELQFLLIKGWLFLGLLRVVWLE